MRSQAVNIKMIDVLWDRYFQDSFKPKQEINQGAGVRTKVSSNGKKDQITGQYFSVVMIIRVNYFHQFHQLK